MLNTGIIAVRNSPLGRVLTKRWLELQIDFGHPCGGPADQPALQGFVLEHWLDDYDAKGRPCDVLAKKYTDQPWLGMRTSRFDGLDKADKCYNKMLVAAGKPTHNRSAKGICLLPINRRLNMHEDKQQ